MSDDAEIVPVREKMRTKPTKLTPEMQVAICETLSCGVDVETACRRQGIGRTTFYEWCKRGRAGEQPYADFLAATDVAMAECEVDITRNIIRASRQRWQAGAWLLKWRKSGGVQKVELTGKDGMPVSGTLTAESAEIIRQRILYGEQPVPQLSAGAQQQLADDPSNEFAEFGASDEPDEGP